MDGDIPTISADDLYTRLGTASAPALVDVRRRDHSGFDDRLIVGAIHHDAEHTQQWFNSLPADRLVVVYCADGCDLSRSAARALRNVGIEAVRLAEGIVGWRNWRLPIRQKLSEPTDKWVTRARPKIDRIACPWLISRFINPRAEFLYVPPSDVLSVASKTGAIPFDIDGVKYAHEGDRCSFDTILRIYGIANSALDCLATIVRGADTSRHDLAPQCGGLFAISLGLSANFPNDHEMLAHGIVMYDALYVWCRSLQAETHNWPAKALGAAQG